MQPRRLMLHASCQLAVLNELGLAVGCATFSALTLFAVPEQETHPKFDSGDQQFIRHPSSINQD